MRKFSFLALLIVSLALWWHRLGSAMRLSLASESYTHLLLILPLCCGLIYLQRGTFPGADPKLAVGLPILLFALGTAAVARYWLALPAGTPLALSMFALVVWWVGSVITCFGLPTFRTFIFPLCFLLLVVPLPTAMLGSVITFLQRESAASAHLLFRLAGVPVTQDGFVLSIPDLDIEVAQECSSIRSSMMLFVVTLILTHLFLRSPWKRLLLVAFSIPISVIKNGFRIFVIAELGTRVDPGFLTGNLHHHGGPVFFVVALVVVIGLLFLLRRYELRALRDPEFHILER